VLKTVHTIRAFIEHEVTAGKKPATVHRHHRSSARGSEVTQSLFRRGGAVGAQEYGPGDLGRAGASARLGLEGDQGIYWEREGGAPSGPGARTALRSI
jgi:hypothetical protein